MSPLGTLRSWTLDSLLGGALLPPTLLGTAAAIIVMLDSGGNMRQLAWVLFCSSMIGAGLGPVLGAGAWAVARWTWRVPLLTLSVGPALGVLAAVAFLNVVSWTRFGHGPQLDTVTWTTLVGLGAFVLAPPWVGYVAVRSRGRPGWPVVLAALLWGSGAVAFLLGLLWMREQLRMLP